MITAPIVRQIRFLGENESGFEATKYDGSRKVRDSRDPIDCKDMLPSVMSNPTKLDSLHCAGNKK